MRWVFGVLVGLGLLATGSILFTAFDYYFSGNLSLSDRSSFINRFETAVISQDFSANGFPNAKFYCFDEGLVGDAGQRAMQWASANGIDAAFSLHKSPSQDVSSYVLYNTDSSYMIVYGGQGLYEELNSPLNFGREPICNRISKTKE